MMKRFLNFQKLLLRSYLGCLFSHERSTYQYRADSIIICMLLVPVFAFTIVDCGYSVMLYFSTLPMIMAIMIINRVKGIIDMLPVSKRFVVANFMITSVLSSLSFLAFFLALGILTTIIDIVTRGIDFFWISVYEQMVLIMLFGFCLYVICLAIMLLPAKIKIVSGTMACAALTSGVVCTYLWKGRRGNLVQYFLINKFGFWPSLAAVVLLAAVFAVLGLSVLPGLYKRHSMAVA